MDESDIARAEERIQNAVEAAAAGIRRAVATVHEPVTHCVDCGEEIPEKRRMAAPFARRCLPCQEGAEQ